MIVSRRSAIKSGAAVVALASVGSIALSAPRPALVVFDSRILASCAFAQHHVGPRIDVAGEDENLWKAFRTEGPKGTVIGMTAWSDWVVVRGLLEEKGKRRKTETARGLLFHWSMI